MGPVVLNHVDPQCKNSDSKPHYERELQASRELPQEVKTESLCNDPKNGAGRDPKRQRLADVVGRQILNAPIRHYAEVHGSPKAVACEFVGIAIVVGIFVMQTMTIYPCDRIHVDREGIVHDGDGLCEPNLVIQGTMSYSQMKNICQIQPAQKPTKDQVGSAE